MKKNNAGFSLIELIVVISILGVLVALVRPTYTKYVKEAKEVTIDTNVQTLYKVVTAYMASEGNHGTSHNFSHDELGEYLSGSIEIIGGFKDDGITPVNGANIYGHKIPVEKDDVCIHYIAAGGKYDAAGLTKPVTKDTYVIEVIDADGILQYNIFD